MLEFVEFWLSKKLRLSCKWHEIQLLINDSQFKLIHMHIN